MFLFENVPTTTFSCRLMYDTRKKAFPTKNCQNWKPKSVYFVRRNLATIVLPSLHRPLMTFGYTVVNILFSSLRIDKVFSCNFGSSSSYNFPTSISTFWQNNLIVLICRNVQVSFPSTTYLIWYTSQICNLFAEVKLLFHLRLILEGTKN